MPRGANIISSLVIFKVKSGDEGTLKLKGRRVVTGNSDYDIDLVLSDCAAVGMISVRLVNSLPYILGFNLSTADKKGA